MQDQLLQGAVQVVGLGEPVTGAGLVDDAVLHLAVHPEKRRQTWVNIRTLQRVAVREQVRGRGLHNGAGGVAARFAAVPDQEGSVSLPSQQSLGLMPVDVPQTPQALVVMRKVLLILHHAVLTERHEEEELQRSSRDRMHTAGTFSCSYGWLLLSNQTGSQAGSETHSSVVSFFRPSHSFSFLCRTPFWVSHLKRTQTEPLVATQLPPGPLLVPVGGAYIRYWSLVLRSWIRSGLMLFIFLSISRLSPACFFRSTSRWRLLSTISLMRDFSLS